MENPDLRAILLEHGRRGLRIQLVLRGALVLFALAAVTFVPPLHDRAALRVIAAVYAVWSIGVIVLTRRGGDAPVRYVWLALFVDLVALAALTILAGEVSAQSWTADLLVNGFFLIPLLAATQLRPWVNVAVGVPTVCTYLLASVATRQANGFEPWGSVLLRTAALAAVACGCLLLSFLQRSRVVTIGGLVADRTSLLHDALTIQDRERRELAENLHDGALQYILAARQDIKDARTTGDSQSFDRVELALTESAALLRTSMTELHPAVLDQAGLPAAVAEIGAAAQVRAGFEFELAVDGWDQRLSTDADGLLFSTARELLRNVVKHAQARHVRLELAYDGHTARLAVIDDGIGIERGQLNTRLAEGHIGLATRQVRIAGAGGRLEISLIDPHGTSVTVMVPASTR